MSSILGTEPYFDEPFYVGYNVNGSELGLDPHAEREGITTAITYWGVENIAFAAEELGAKGVRLQGAVQDVGGGIRLARFQTASGSWFGIIENPNFAIND